MNRPRPLTKPQRELLNLCRGEGLNWFVLKDSHSHLLKVASAAIAYGLINRVYRDSQFLIVTSKHGEARLVEHAPPPPPGRAPCVNPRCWKTEPASRFPGCDTIICSPCFKMVPELRREYRHLWSRYRKVERLARKHDRDATTAMHSLGMQIDANWRRITEFFTAPEKPEGLDTFLQEMGWSDESTGNEHADGAEGA